MTEKQQEKSTVAIAEERHYRKTRQGYVVSDKMDKTVIVEVEDRVKHALYGKVIRRSSKVKAHDETNTAAVGDRVLIMETRPLSATKHLSLIHISEPTRRTPISYAVFCLKKKKKNKKIIIKKKK